MKALIFAAGLGERMRPLTDNTPKPLLAVGGKPLIVWHLEKLAAIGIRDVVINTSWLAKQFPETLGDGSAFGLHLAYTYEGPTPLETGGGMWHALPLLGRERISEEPFIAINGDIWTDYDFAKLPREPKGDAHLVMVDNPEHNPRGDFTLLRNGQLSSGTPHPEDIAATGDAGMRLTFAGIGVYRPSLFDDWRRIVGDAPGAREKQPRFKLAPLLRAAMGRGAVTGERHSSHWTDVGTPDRLESLNRFISLNE
jgi:N-acetyl-alpha-D-muramate 1-phosphate uridylyltransferase